MTLEFGSPYTLSDTYIDIQFLTSEQHGGGGGPVILETSGFILKTQQKVISTSSITLD